MDVLHLFRLVLKGVQNLVDVVAKVSVVIDVDQVDIVVRHDVLANLVVRVHERRTRVNDHRSDLEHLVQEVWRKTLNLDRVVPVEGTDIGRKWGGRLKTHY